MSFYDNMEKETTKKTTRNGAPTYSSSLNSNLDFFAMAGASRNKQDNNIKEMFAKAYHEDREMALRNLVHLRDIRQGGLGERATFRVVLDYLLNNSGTMFKSNKIIVGGLLKYIPEIGRWDDVLYIFNNSNDKWMKQTVAKLISEQMFEDIKNMREGKPISLLAKWMPSINTSSKETVGQAKELIKYLFGKVSPHHKKVYRKTLSKLRGYLEVVEVKMTNKQWEDIDFSKVPSVASIRYRDAFFKHNEDRYRDYLEKLSEGKTKVNASVTYPYQIVQAYEKSMMRGTDESDLLLEEAWKSLPNYLEGVDERAIVVADTSGSMQGTPMTVSISLAIYCAQRLQGEFKGKYISFSSVPKLNTVYEDEPLIDSIRRVYSTDWGMSTDINKVFDLILDTAINNDMTQEEIPDKIIIVSDMEFSMAQGVYSYGHYREEEVLTETNYQVAKKKFQNKGYKLPQVVFWNVNSVADTIPVRKDEIGTALVSGLTPSIFTSVLNGDIEDPVQMMKGTLNTERYDFVKEILK